MAQFEGILFDLDGTLWNSIRSILPAWNRVGRKAGVEVTAEMLASIMGKSIQEVGDTFFPDYGDAEARLKLALEGCAEECVELRAYGGDLFPGVEETIRSLAKTHRLAIISNCTHGYIEAFLEAHHVADCFTDFEHPGNTGLSKGENIRLVMERNHIKSAVYVGDTQGDANAAAFAGIPFVYAAYGFGTVSAEAYAARLENFAELPKLLEKLKKEKTKICSIFYVKTVDFTEKVLYNSVRAKLSLSAVTLPEFWYDTFFILHRTGD